MGTAMEDVEIHPQEGRFSLSRLNPSPPSEGAVMTLALATEALAAANGAALYIAAWEVRLSRHGGAVGTLHGVMVHKQWSLHGYPP